MVYSSLYLCAADYEMYFVLLFLPHKRTNTIWTIMFPFTYSIVSHLYVFVNIFFLFSWNIFKNMRHELRRPCPLCPSAFFLYTLHFVMELFKPLASIVTGCVSVFTLVTWCIVHHINPLLFKYSSTLFRYMIASPSLPFFRLTRPFLSSVSCFVGSGIPDSATWFNSLYTASI